MKIVVCGIVECHPLVFKPDPHRLVHVWFFLKLLWCAYQYACACVCVCACSVNYRLLPTFHSNAISLRAIILQTSGFHQSIAHPFVALETKFYVDEIITVSVTCKKLAHVIYQLPATVIYYRPPIHFPISFIGQCLNFVP